MRKPVNTLIFVFWGTVAKCLRGIAFLFAGAIFFNEEIVHKALLGAGALLLMAIYFAVCCRFLGKAE